MKTETKDTRSRILQASVDLLEAGQGKGVRMTDIAKQAGITRQALYLHFKTRAELLIATTRYVDELQDIDARLAASRSAQTGVARLAAYVDAWGNYIPEIYGIGKALLAMRDTDDAAAEAWDGRMQAMREGCEAAINALINDQMLAAEYSPEQAVDLLWTLLSVRNWEHLVIDCGWSQVQYIEQMTLLTRRMFVAEKQ